MTEQHGAQLPVGLLFTPGPRDLITRTGVDVGSGQAATALAGQSHPIFVLTPGNGARRQDAALALAVRLLAGFQVALNEAVTIREARLPQPAPPGQ